jgi:type II secretory pathway component PulM
MVDDLTRRVVTNQINDEAATVVRDAECLAAAYAQFARDVATGRALSGEAYRMTQTANEILRRSARLDGLREIANVAGLTEAKNA